ncbi:MAG: hypothetical protein H6747_09170 [Deltaproteobacteria bacterium]|nr:hypothetical protein [Deltaproteobacteria bacterium]
MKAALSLLVCALLALLVAPAAAAPSVPGPLPVLDLPPLPGSAFATRAQHHQHEADARGEQPLPDPNAALGWGAVSASFGALLEQGWRLGHQEATVDVDPTVPGLAVELTVTVEAIEATGSVALRLPIVTIEAVHLADGATVTWSSDTPFGQITVVDVTLDPPLQPGESRKIAIRYGATLDCNAKTTLLRTCTFDDQFSQVLFFRVFADHAKALHAPHTSTLHVLTPADRAAAAPGEPKGFTWEPDGRLRWTFVQNERTENGGFSIAAYAFTGTDPGQNKPGEPWLRLVTLEDYKGAATGLLASAKDILAFYGERFVPFPWSGLSLIQVANNFGGGYAPLAGIFMLRNVFGAQAGAQGWTSWNELTAHEIAHQWWGNLARPMGTADVSLSESLAEFSSCLYTEKTLESRSQLIEDNLSYVYTVGENDDRPLGSATVYTSPAYVPIVYHKGAVVLDMLRYELGEETMLEGLAIYAKAFDRDYAKVADLRAAMEKSSGRDLGWFFDQWWGSKGRIDVEFAARVVEKEGGGYEVRLRMAQLGAKPLRFKLPLRITYAGGEVETRSVDVLSPDTGWVSVVSFETTARPLIVRPDVSRHLLRRFRILDGADVSLDGMVDGVDLIESAFRQRRTIVWKKSFFPNTLWDELFDGDGSFTVDSADLDLIFERAGESSIDF